MRYDAILTASLKQNLLTNYAKQPESADYKGSYAFVSLGCPKNTVDSERMMGLLKLDGYNLVADPALSDFVIVNTCGFIENARKESFASIDEMIALKKQGYTKGVIVTGCLAERQKEQLLEQRPEIDSLVGVFGREEITKVADRLMGDMVEQRTVFQPASIRTLPDTDRLRITPQHFAYLKISEGCDRLCTFCAIPKMRGKHVTKPMEEVVAEAKQLAAAGVRELNVVAQDTTYYGMDLYGEPRLTELLTELNGVEGIDWIRLLYFYPMYIDDRLIDAINRLEKIIPYIDMPLQHINDQMLKRMSRRVNREQTEQIISDLRNGIDQLVLRTTFITGFPGETEEQFLELNEFIREQRFERAGVFTYSYESDTPSAKLADPVPEEVMNARREHLMKTQQKIIFETNEQKVGQRVLALVDQKVPEEPNVWVGRTIADAPDIDGLVFITADGKKLKPGDFIECEIVTTNGYDLVGYALGQPS